MYILLHPIITCRMVTDISPAIGPRRVDVCKATNSNFYSNDNKCLHAVPISLSGIGAGKHT